MYYQQSSPETETPEQTPLCMKCEENSSTLRKNSAKMSVHSAEKNMMLSLYLSL